MRIQKRLELTQKIATIALNEALRGWQPPVQGHYIAHSASRLKFINGHNARMV